MEKIKKAKVKIIQDNKRIKQDIKDLDEIINCVLFSN